MELCRTRGRADVLLAREAIWVVKKMRGRGKGAKSASSLFHPNHFAVASCRSSNFAPPRTSRTQQEQVSLTTPKTSTTLLSSPNARPPRRRTERLKMTRERRTRRALLEIGEEDGGCDLSVRFFSLRDPSFAPANSRGQSASLYTCLPAAARVPFFTIISEATSFLSLFIFCSAFADLGRDLADIAPVGRLAICQRQRLVDDQEGQFGPGKDPCTM